MITIRQPLGIASSPILAPDLDLYGQQRVDDPAVASPRAWARTCSRIAVPSIGPISRDRPPMLIDPRDNDAQGRIGIAAIRTSKCKDATLFYFSIQLIDGVPPSDESYGSGPDRNTVLPETVMVTQGRRAAARGCGLSLQLRCQQCRHSFDARWPASGNRIMRMKSSC